MAQSLQKDLVIQKTFENLEHFFNQKGLSYLSYFKEIEKDLLNDVHFLMKKVEHDPIHQDLAKSLGSDWNLDHQIPFLISTVFIQKYKPLHDLVSLTDFEVNGMLMPLHQVNHCA